MIKSSLILQFKFFKYYEIAQYLFCLDITDVPIHIHLYMNHFLGILNNLIFSLFFHSHHKSTL